MPTTEMAVSVWLFHLSIANVIYAQVEAARSKRRNFPLE